jgi:Protein of unknown function (DUF2917)
MNTRLLPLSMPSTQTLPPQVLACTVPGPLRVRVEHGAVWLTWDGEPDDHFLVAGEALEVPRGRKAWLSTEPRLAPGAAIVAVEPAPAPPDRRPRWGVARA